MSKRTRETKPKTDDAIAAAMEASKAAPPTLTDAQKLDLFQATRAFDMANNNATPQGIAAALEQLMHERIQQLQAAKGRLDALGKALGRAGYSLDAHTGIYTKTP